MAFHLNFSFGDSYMKIAIASGKGGTGKTTISTTLAYYFAQQFPTALLDCDVEEPDANIFLNIPVSRTFDVDVLIPQVDMDLCTGCGRCEKMCQYNAIVLIKGKPLVLPELCHSCGGCYLVCPEKAIKEVKRSVGTVEVGVNGNLHYAGGILNIGEHMAIPLIDEVKKEHYNATFRIVDAPPGSSCPVVHSMQGNDLIIIVVEPTPFGFHDAVLAYDVAKTLNIPCAVVINNLVEEYKPLFSFLEKENIPVLAVIPHDVDVARSCAQGNCIEYMLTKYQDKFEAIMRYIKEKVQ